MLMLTIALYLLIRAQQRESLAQYAALPIAFSYVIRPTNAVSVIILSIYVLLAHRRIFIRFLLWAACIALPFVLYSYSAFHLLLPPYYLSQETSITTLGEALLGHLFSPGRGLIIYSPIMLVAIAGIILKVRTKNLTSLEFALVIILLLHWLMISLFKDWPGGASFGARYFADVVPYFVYFLIPIVLWLKDYRVQSARLLIIGLTLVSLWINWRGAIRQETFFSYDHIESIWHDWSFLK